MRSPRSLAAAPPSRARSRRAFRARCATAPAATAFRRSPIASTRSCASSPRASRRPDRREDQPQPGDREDAPSRRSTRSSASPIAPRRWPRACAAGSSSSAWSSRCGRRRHPGCALRVPRVALVALSHSPGDLEALVGLDARGRGGDPPHHGPAPPRRGAPEPAGREPGADGGGAGPGRSDEGARGRLPHDRRSARGGGVTSIRSPSPPGGSRSPSRRLPADAPTRGASSTRSRSTRRRPKSRTS